MMKPSGLGPPNSMMNNKIKRGSTNQLLQIYDSHRSRSSSKHNAEDFKKVFAGGGVSL